MKKESLGNSTGLTTTRAILQSNIIHDFWLCQTQRMKINSLQTQFISDKEKNQEDSRMEKHPNQESE